MLYESVELYSNDGLRQAAYPLQAPQRQNISWETVLCESVELYIKHGLE